MISTRYFTLEFALVVYWLSWLVVATTSREYGVTIIGSVVVNRVLDAVHTLLSEIQWGLSNEVSQMSKISYYMLSENAEDKVRINFGFSLCTVPL